MSFNCFMLSVVAGVVAYYICKCLDAISTLIFSG